MGSPPKDLIRGILEGEGKPDPERPNRFYTNSAWKKIGTKEFFVIDLYDKLPDQTIYQTMYMYGVEKYQFTVAFSTNRKTDDAMKAMHERIVSEVRFPE